MRTLTMTPLVLMLATAVGCGSVLTTLNNELVLAQADLDEMARMTDDPEVKDVLGHVGAYVGHVQFALGAYLEAGSNEPSSLLEALQQALAATETILVEWVPSGGTQHKIRMGVLVLRSVLRRIEGYVLPPSESSLIGT